MRGITVLVAACGGFNAHCTLDLIDTGSAGWAVALALISALCIGSAFWWTRDWR